jgi:hypothetical protein
MSSAGPTSYAKLLAAVQSTLHMGLKDYNFRDGAFTSQLATASTPIDILHTLISSLFPSETEKNKLRPLLSTLILLAPTEFTTRGHEIYDQLACSILKPDGTPGHVLKAVQTLFEEDARRRGLFNTPTAGQANDPETGEVLFTHAVGTKMNVTVLPQPQGKEGGKENRSLGARPQFQPSEVARAKQLGTNTSGATVGGRQQPQQPHEQHGELHLPARIQDEGEK